MVLNQQVRCCFASGQTLGPGGLEVALKRWLEMLQEDGIEIGVSSMLSVWATEI